MPLRFHAATAAALLAAAWPGAFAGEPATQQRSAFDGYRRFADEPVADWRALNDTVGRIGGWQAYAREAAAAAQAASGAAPAGATSRPTSPAAPASATPAPAAGGHGMHFQGQGR